MSYPQRDFEAKSPSRYEQDCWDPGGDDEKRVRRRLESLWGVELSIEQMRAYKWSLDRYEPDRVLEAIASFAEGGGGDQYDRSRRPTAAQLCKSLMVTVANTYCPTPKPDGVNMKTPGQHMRESRPEWLPSVKKPLLT